MKALSNMALPDAIIFKDVKRGRGVIMAITITYWIYLRSH
jgi:hypothetical protein